jgi:hypothetical protein
VGNAAEHAGAIMFAMKDKLVSAYTASGTTMDDQSCFFNLLNVLCRIYLWEWQ